MESSSQKDLFSSVVSNIKSYSGDDPLRPWIQGIRKIHQSLPPHVLDEKLPRFLQKCVQTFESERRYRNDSRYLAVWIQLMDYVEDAKVLLKKMENKKIGVKRAKFYIAYALYYEKKKRFEDAEKMYQLGVHNLAVPMGELQKSYDQFIHRMKLLSHRRAKDSVSNTSGTTFTGSSSQKTSDLKNCQHAECYFQSDHARENSCRVVDKHLAQSRAISIQDLDSSAPFSRDDGGWSHEGDVCRHDMLDPTSNTKEAMSMFQVAREPEIISDSLNQVKPKSYNNQYSIKVLADEEMEEEEEESEGNYNIANIQTSGFPKKAGHTKKQKPFVGAFKILADDEDVDEDDDDDDDDDHDEDEEADHEDCVDRSNSSIETGTRRYDARLNEDTVIRRLREDTVIRKFIGSTVFDEPKVEDACHHGLVDPTVNLKQAMDDINGMFGEPLNFVKTGKPKKRDKQYDRKPVSSNHGFFILADDDIENDVKGQSLPISHSSNRESDFLEPTIFTKEAMDEINNLFGKPLDF